MKKLFSLLLLIIIVTNVNAQDPVVVKLEVPAVKQPTAYRVSEKAREPEMDDYNSKILNSVRFDIMKLTDSAVIVNTKMNSQYEIKFFILEDGDYVFTGLNKGLENNIKITILENNTNKVIAKTTTNSNGVFWLFGLKSGKYSLVTSK